MTRRKTANQEELARNRAEIIMKVRAGFLTATEGATLLGVSRKTYYKWENRALKAMLLELENRKTGRPILPVCSDSEDELRNEVEALREEKELLKKQLELKDLIYQLRIEEIQEKKQSARTKQRKKKS